MSKIADREGAEEMVSEIVSPYLKRLTYDKQADSATVESVVEAGLIGALTSLAYGGAQTAVKKVAGVNTVIPSELENVATYDEALKKGWDSNDKATVEKVSQAKAETLKTISQELANMSEDKRAKYIDKHNLGGMFNANGTLTDNYNNAYNGNMELARAYDTRYVSMGADVNVINSDMQSLTDNMVKEYAQKNNVSIEQATAESKPIQVYQGELSDKAQKSVVKAKKFTSIMSKIGLNNLNLVVVDENPMFNGVVVNGKNIYVGKDTFENGKWTKAIVHEVLHTNEDTETYKVLADLVRKIAEGKGILNARQQEMLDRYQGSDQKTVDSELTALLTEELIGNEQFIDKVVEEQPNIAMRFVKKIQNLIKLFKMSGAQRAEYKVLTLAENMYLRSAYDHGRQNLIQSIEQGREDNKQVQVDEQKDEVGVDQTLALQYNKKGIYEQIPKQEYAIISSRIMEDNSRYRAREEELPRYGAARSANYFYVYENFALGNFGVLKQIKITDANREYIASIEAKIGENNGESIIGSTSELNRVLEVLKSQARRNRRNNALDSEGRADSNNGGISLGESESNRSGHSQKGNGNKRAVDYHFNDDGSQIVTYSDETKKKNYSLKDTVEKDVLSHYGATYRWTETGYILKDGTRLDLSGRRDGASGGYRTVDHRDIFDIYENVNGTEAMIEFMARGNIRVSPENPGINLQVEPTEEQYRLIQDFVERVGFKEECFSVDFDDKFGDVVETLEYNGKVSGRKVVSDIRYYFKEGKLPYRSELSQFRWSLKPFAEQVDDILGGKDTTSTHLKIMDTPQILQDVGLPKLPILMTARHLDTTVNESGKKGLNYHGLGIDIIKQLPKLIENPALIAESLTRDDSVVLITQAIDKQRRPVIVAIKVNGVGRLENVVIQANVMLSTYGRNNFEQFVNRLLDGNKILFWDKKRSQRISVNPGLQLSDVITNLASDTIIRKIDIKSQDFVSKNPTDIKYSRKSPAPSQVGDIIKARGNLTTDKIFTKDEAKRIIADIEERLVFEDKGKIGTVKGTNELIDRLWKGLNKADKGEYTRVGVEIADYVIKNSVVEDIYECLYGDVEVDEARQVIKTLKQYFHKVKISDRVLGEIKHHFDDKSSKVLSLWRAKEGGLA